MMRSLKTISIIDDSKSGISGCFPCQGRISSEFNTLDLSSDDTANPLEVVEMLFPTVFGND